MAAPLRLTSLEELRRKRTFKFPFQQEGIRREGFLLLHEGQVFAYENVCRHIPVSLDYGDGQFFTPDSKHIICQTHGALYEPDTGRCVAGPCPGAFLRKLPVRVTDSGEILLEFSGE